MSLVTFHLVQCFWISNFLDAVNVDWHEKGKAHQVTWVTRIANNIFKNISYKTFFDMSNEYIWSWSHAFWVMNHRIFTKKLLAVSPKALMRRRKRRKKAIAKCFALHANAQCYGFPVTKYRSPCLLCNIKQSFACFSKHILRKILSLLFE